MVRGIDGVDWRSSGFHCCVASSKLTQSKPVGSLLPPTGSNDPFIRNNVQLSFVVLPPRQALEMVGSGFKRKKERRNQQVIFGFTFLEHELSSALITGLISVSSCKIWTTRIYLSRSEAHGASSSSLCPPHILPQEVEPHQSQRRQKLCSVENFTILTSSTLHHITATLSDQIWSNMI